MRRSHLQRRRFPLHQSSQHGTCWPAPVVPARDLDCLTRMDTRDVIAIPSTFIFVVFGFYLIVMQRLQAWRRRAREEGPRTTPSKWGRLSPAARLRRRVFGIILGTVVAMLLIVVAEHIINAFSL